ncbi:peptidoglycan-binding protein [Ancylobacter sp. A5.8]|uniref:peptidoglycan-binding domain-containing protein n=1 Tax=Ancylobacter gelatini TaxID=2919920 RepID=UPI001F4DC440|nr:peptidoglycan-binding domain-containing protein [Ancylobacter gelatini]MCJ8143848.1 peptidoglycan-binding protein [Ancylobacter gelatini]
MPRSYASDLLANDIGLEGGRLADYTPRSERRRSDLFMAFLAAAAAAGVLFNALALQNGRRPDITSLFSLVSAQKPAPVPPSAPAELRAPEPAPAAPSPVEAAPPAPAAPIVLAPSIPLPPVKPAAPPPKPAAPVQAQPAIQPPMPLYGTPAANSAANAATQSPAAFRPPGDLGVSARVMEVQKALASIGYGPVPIDGRTGTATQQAIQRFERDRRLPVTGEISDKLIRELNAVAGFSIR